jgi:PI-3-kinase-related kinase SMG-1
VNQESALLAAAAAAAAMLALEAIEPVAAALRRAQPRLMTDAAVLVHELGRVTVLHDEELLAALQDLHTDVMKRAAAVREEAARLRLQLDAGGETGGEANRDRVLGERRTAVMMPAVAALDRIVRSALSGGGYSTPHVQSFAARHGAGLAAAAEHFAKAPDPGEGWRAVKSEMTRLARGLQRRRELRLRDLSPALAGLRGRVTAAPMPGTEAAAAGAGGYYDGGGNGGLVTVVSVGERVTALPTKTRPKRITLLGSDGVHRTFLLKGHEDLRLDERAMHVLAAANTILAADRCARRRRLCARHYSVTPLSGYGGLIQWVERATPMSAMFAGWQRRARAAAQLAPPGAAPGWVPTQASPVAATTRPLDLFYQRISTALRAAGILPTASRRQWPRRVLRDTVSGLSAEVPRDLLQRELWCSSPSSAAWLTKVTAHARSVATASVLGHLLGLGDRHLDNVLVDLGTGEVVHIDYNIAFDRGLTLPVPELVPFRLTPMMVAALGPTGTHGAFELAAESTLSALRGPQGRDVLLGLLEAFVRDPLIEWTEEGGGGRKHLRQGDAASEHRSLEVAAGLTLFASRARGEMRAGLDTAAAALEGVDARADATLGTVSAAAAEAGMTMAAAAAAGEGAEAAFAAAAAAAAASDAASDAEEFSAVRAVAARAAAADAATAVNEAAHDAAGWAERSRRVLERIAGSWRAPDGSGAAFDELAALRDTATVVRSTGAPPALRAAPFAASLSLPPQLENAAAAADAEGAAVLATRDRAVARAAAVLVQYGSFLAHRLPPSYPTTNRRAVWATALAAAAATTATADTPAEIVAAAKATMRQARRQDPTGARTWAAYSAARHALSARELTILPGLLTAATAAAAAAEGAERHAADMMETAEEAASAYYVTKDAGYPAANALLGELWRGALGSGLDTGKGSGGLEGDGDATRLWLARFVGEDEGGGVGAAAGAGGALAGASALGGVVVSAPSVSTRAASFPDIAGSFFGASAFFGDVRDEEGEALEDGGGGLEEEEASEGVGRGYPTGEQHEGECVNEGSSRARQPQSRLWWSAVTVSDGQSWPPPPSPSLLPCGALEDDLSSLCLGVPEMPNEDPSPEPELGLQALTMEAAPRYDEVAFAVAAGEQRRHGIQSTSSGEGVLSRSEVTAAVAAAAESIAAAAPATAQQQRVLRGIRAAAAAAAALPHALAQLVTPAALSPDAMAPAAAHAAVAAAHAAHALETEADELEQRTRAFDSEVTGPKTSSLDFIPQTLNRKS